MRTVRIGFLTRSFSPQTRSSVPLVMQALVEAGANDCEIARRTGIPRSTIREWRSRDFVFRLSGEVDTASLPEADYAYLLGLYLGDGYICPGGRTYRALLRTGRTRFRSHDANRSRR